MIRGASIGRDPARALTSEGFTPEALSATRTSPGPGSATDISPTTSTSRAAPVLSYQAARIVPPTCVSPTGSLTATNIDHDRKPSTLPGRYQEAVRRWRDDVGRDIRELLRHACELRYDLRAP